MTPRGSPSRLWLADHLLRDVVGHHLGYNLAIADAAVSAGHEPVLVVHRGFDPMLARAYRSEMILRTDWRAAPPSWISRDQRLLRVLEIISAARFRADLRRLSSMVRSDDLVFAQMIAPRHFMAWAEWLEDFANPPRLALHLGYQPHRFASALLQKAWARISRKTKARITLVTDSEKLVGPFSEALQAEVRYLPHIVSRNFPRADGSHDAGPVIFFAPGNARIEKGFGELLAAIELSRALLEEGRAKFIVQCHEPDAHCTQLLQRRPRLSGIEWIGQPLVDEEYARRFSEASVILVPYHLDHYALRTSGVFCEARVAGKPAIATRGSWAGDRVFRDGGGWLCEERNPVDLANCLRLAVGDCSSKAARAATLQEDAVKEFSAKDFVSNLFALAG